MANKRVVRFTVSDPQHKVDAVIPVGIVEGARRGPTLAVIAGVHATEYAVHEGAQRFWRSLNPAEIAGTVYVVLTADVTAFYAHTQYTNPVDGKNLNRVWPGNPDGTLTERIAHTITHEVVRKADAVVDCHGGEFDEAIDLFIITHSTGDAALDKRTLDFCMDLGFPFVEVTPAGGAVLGAGTGAAEAIKSGRPAATLEAGGRGLMEERHIAATYEALHNALKHLGMTPGRPTPFLGTPIKLDHGILLRTTAAGIYEPVVTIGNWIRTGELFARVLDFDGTILEELHAPEGGVILDVITARGIKAGGFAGKIGVI